AFAFWSDAIERFKNQILMFRGYAWSLVAHRYAAGRRDGDGNQSGTATVIYGIAHHVADRPRQGGRTAFAYNTVRSVLECDLVTRCNRQRRKVRDYPPGDVDEIDGLVHVRRLVVALEVQKLLSGIGQA